MVVRIRKLAPRVPGTERRKAARRQPTVIPYLKEAQLVAGPKARLLNISRRGAMFETEAGLRPGSVVCLRIITAEAIMMLKGRIVHSKAVSFNRSRFRYHSAIEFDSEFPLADVQLMGESELPCAEAPLPDSQESMVAEPSPDTDLPIQNDLGDEASCTSEDSEKDSEPEPEDFTVH
jgi:hypothetical protein